MESRIKTLFLQGNFKKILTILLESPAFCSDFSVHDYQWVIGALCFAGRKEEAEALFQELRTQSSPLSRAACQFFLGVAFCRHGQYLKARKYFSSNLRSNRKVSGQLGFFSWQGLAFYRYVLSDFKKSEAAALKSLTYATYSQFTYGSVLALDIMGHSLVQQGQITAGIARLSDARETAISLGNGGLSDSIEISSLVYRAQYGLAPGTVIRDLQKALKQLDPQNSYALAGLLLEMANQFILRGKLENASASLNEASTLIYRSQHRRYAHLLALRFAEVSYRRGEFGSALQAVQMQRALLDKKYDRMNFLMALGMEVKILKTLKMTDQIEPLLALLSHLTYKTGRSISIHIYERGVHENLSTLGEDRIEKLLTSTRSRLKSGVTSLPGVFGVIRSPYKGLIYEALGLPLGSSWVVAGGNDLVILEKGEVTRRREKIPGQLLRLLTALSSDSKTKEDLIREIWGYAYHPLHHDPLVYQAIARLREVLGSHSQFIEISAGGYRLRKGVGVILLSGPSTETDYIPRKVVDPLIRKEEKGYSSDLNERQMRILDLLEKRRFLKVRDCLSRFAVSDMTLKRDFSELVQGGWVRRIGRARATRYTLQNSSEDTQKR